ncbi:MAG TPA: succinate dehydrogenase cytochrome b subunit [Fibrobacteria bacterium]|nr:succinate dehydrogenase cytochrome b subunit [Fibrobacteria bacterium]
MHALKKYMGSSIGRKQMMGATGIVLYGYLLVHLVGNVGMLFGAERYNKYGYLLLHEMAEIIVPIEIGLIAAILVHIRLAIGLTLENRAARPVAYAVKKSSRQTLHSASMMMTGSAILLFVFIHVANFRYGGAGMGGMATVTYDGVVMKDLYGTMMRAFSMWWYTAGYVLAMILIFSHLSHGVQSSMQSLGFNHPKYTPFVHFAGRAYAVLISGSFGLLAVWAYFQHGGTP